MFHTLSEFQHVSVTEHWEQVNTFNYLGRNISYEGEKVLNIKVTNFITIAGTINQTFKSSLVSRHTRIRTYKTLARPTLPYRTEAWKINYEMRLISAEMRFRRRTA
jgi:hypothetical protein